MSGPKCDVFELGGEELRRQREEQERLRQEELKRLREEERRKMISGQADELFLKFSEMAKERTTEEKVNNSLKTEFEEVYREYRAAAKLAEVEADVFEFSEKNADLIIEKMQEKIEQWNELAFSRQCNCRVNEIIDETIEEMGYELIGERHNDNWKQPLAKLYQYDENTAISVISTNGQFTLEVVTSDTTDRQITEKEAQMLEEHMKEFCVDYEELKKRLENKNLLRSKRVFHMPPSKAYARVVNTSLYKKKRKTRKYGDDYVEEVKQKGTHGKKGI